MYVCEFGTKWIDDCALLVLMSSAAVPCRVDMGRREDENGMNQSSHRSF